MRIFDSRCAAVLALAVASCTPVETVGTGGAERASQAGVTESARGDVAACTDDVYLVEVEVKYSDEENGVVYYERGKFLPLSERWSVAHPSWGKIKVKPGVGIPPAEKIKLEYFSPEGELLATNEMQLASLPGEDSNVRTTVGDVDLIFEQFFKRAIEGNVRLYLVANGVTVCSSSVRLNGYDEQDVDDPFA
jgi:hypothetical protein